MKYKASSSYYLFPVVVFLFLLGALSCDPIEEEISNDPSLELLFSTDTVLFDTLLTERASFSQGFRLYNPNKNAISIDRVYLGLRDASAYSITVGGKKQVEVEDQIVFGKDSLLVLIEVFIDPMDEELPFLVKDSVVFEYNQKRQDVKLVSWGQDAHYLSKEVITCDDVWTAGKPYVIYDTVLVAENCALTIEEGTKILFESNSALAVAGSLIAQGSAENKIEFRNSRLDYDVAPGQWNSIIFLVGSDKNIIDHAIIKNGTIGLWVGTPDDNDEYDLEVSNTSISHMSSTGIAAFSADIHAYNVEIFNCTDALTSNIMGGNYRYEHCTFSNEPNLFIRNQASVIFSDFDPLFGSELQDDLNLFLNNSIVWGTQREELVLVFSEQNNITAQITNNIIKTKDENYILLGNQIAQTYNYPGFYAPGLFNFQLDSISNARDSASVSTITHDLIGTLRDELPDIGAYERKDSIP